MFTLTDTTIVAADLSTPSTLVHCASRDELALKPATIKVNCGLVITIGHGNVTPTLPLITCPACRATHMW